MARSCYLTECRQWSIRGFRLHGRQRSRRSGKMSVDCKEMGIEEWEEKTTINCKSNSESTKKTMEGECVCLYI